MSSGIYAGYHSASRFTRIACSIGFGRLLVVALRAIRFRTVIWPFKA